MFYWILFYIMLVDSYLQPISFPSTLSFFHLNPYCTDRWVDIEPYSLSFSETNYH
ncbi:hypothetical protein BDF14DRAFT_1784221 [Spinellus fusiger]|nr:hypothetical protein BDF14DRAFT_1784221 [Spinellus fusiger]